MAADAPDMDGSDTDGSDRDAQDIAEVFDEDNLDSDSARLARNDEELNFDDMPAVYDATSAFGDSDDEEGPIGEELDDEEIVQLSRQEADERDNREEANDYRASEAFDEDEADLAGGGADVALTYAGDLSQMADAHSGAQSYESRTLSDADIEELGYADAPAAAAAAPGAPAPSAKAQGAPGEGRSFQETAGAGGERSRKEADDAALDEGLEETFLASDPVAVKHIT